MSKHQRQKPPGKSARTRSLTSELVVFAIVLGAAIAAWPVYWWSQGRIRHLRGEVEEPAAQPPVLFGGKLRFTDVDRQSRQFIGYNSSIQLTPGQEAVKRQVLEGMPAACCRESNALTCCCPCNLSKTIWGLSNYVLSVHHASPAQLREAVVAWKEFTNPAGYGGSSCYSGGCSLPFHEDGCGGMSESHLVLRRDRRQS